MLVVVAVGLALVVDHYWRKGLDVLGAACVLAAALRAALPARRAGLLVVRSRPVDVVMLAAVGVAVVVLAEVVPYQPPAG